MGRERGRTLWGGALIEGCSRYAFRQWNIGRKGSCRQNSATYRPDESMDGTPRSTPTSATLAHLEPPCPRTIETVAAKGPRGQYTPDTGQGRRQIEFKLALGCLAQGSYTPMILTITAPAHKGSVSTLAREKARAFLLPAPLPARWTQSRGPTRVQRQRKKQGGAIETPRWAQLRRVELGHNFQDILIFFWIRARRSRGCTLVPAPAKLPFLARALRPPGFWSRRGSRGPRDGAMVPTSGSCRSHDTSSARPSWPRTCGAGIVGEGPADVRDALGPPREPWFPRNPLSDSLILGDADGVLIRASPGGCLWALISVDLATGIRVTTHL